MTTATPAWRLAFLQFGTAVMSGRRHTLPAAVAVASTVLLAAGCGGSTSQPRNLSLAQLTTQGAAHDGDLVRTAGTVASFGHGATLHYWIEDSRSNRVALVPEEKVASFDGQLSW